MFKKQNIVFEKYLLTFQEVAWLHDTKDIIKAYLVVCKPCLACPMSILKVTILDFKLLHTKEKGSTKALKNSNRVQSQSSRKMQWKKLVIT